MMPTSDRIFLTLVKSSHVCLHVRIGCRHRHVGHVMSSLTQPLWWGTCTSWGRQPFGMIRRKRQRHWNTLWTGGGFDPDKSTIHALCISPFVSTLEIVFKRPRSTTMSHHNSVLWDLYRKTFDSRGHTIKFSSKKILDILLKIHSWCNHFLFQKQPRVDFWKRISYRIRCDRVAGMTGSRNKICPKVSSSYYFPQHCMTDKLSVGTGLLTNIFYW